jgi:GNAT superfamily N-acetyltransferase
MTMPSRYDSTQKVTAPAVGTAPRIRAATTASQTEVVRGLFREYRAWLAEHREVTAFSDSLLARGLERLDQEIEDLPGPYAGPRGALYLAYDRKDAVGCAALRPLDSLTMELKRLFVRPGYRGRGVGRKLTERTVRRAQQLGAERIVLDTLPGMTGAISLYTELGFRPISAYWPNPVPSALYFEYRLGGTSA